MERLEKLCVQADERAKRDEGLQSPRELRETQRSGTVAAAAGTPVEAGPGTGSSASRRACGPGLGPAEAKLAEAGSKAAATIDGRISAR